MNRSITFLTQTLAAVLIPGVLVKIFTSLGAFVTEFITDGLGESGVILLPDGSYHAVCFKQGTSWPAAFAFEVTENGQVELNGVVLTLSTATDPLRCRVQGWMRDFSGNAIPFGTIRTTPLTNGPMGISFGVMFADGIHRADKDGRIQFELMRGLKYMVEFPSIAEPFFYRPAEASGDTWFASKVFDVPNQSALALEDFLFPVPIRVFWSSAVVNLTVGGSADLNVAVLRANGIQEESMLCDELSYTSSDTSVFTVERVDKDTLRLHGVSVGTETVEAKRTQDTHRLPEPTLVVDALSVVVT